MTARRAGELAALGVGAAVWAYVGWDGALWDARFQLVLHLAALAAVAGLGVIALRGGGLPRTRIDLPILALLLAFGVASLSAWNPGLSARALAAILAAVAMLPVALVALRHRPAWAALAVCLPIIGHSVGTLAVMGWRRVEWMVAGGPGFPPIRLGHEGTPFGSVAVPPFVILAALPIALAIPQRGPRVAVVAGLLAVGAPLAVLSGSRSAWLAMGVAAVVLGGTRLLRRDAIAGALRRLQRGGAVAALLLLAAAGVVVTYIGPRLLEVSSLVYRGFLWRDTLAAWSADPLLGIGPGAMPFARQAAAPTLSFPVRQPHSHNVPLGILGDAGLIGLAVAGLLLVSFLLVAGPWRQKTLTGRAASAVLIGLGAGMLFEDLTFLPNFNLLVVLLVALALMGADAVRWQAVRASRPAAVAVAAGSLALLVVMIAGDSAAVAYRMGVDAGADGRWKTSQAYFERSVALDPWHPTGPKSLAVAAERAGNDGLALRSAGRAVELNPGDGPSWTNLAILCLASGDGACAEAAAGEAVVRAQVPGRELVNAALVYEALGRVAAADDAYRLSLQTNLWTGLTTGWPRPVPLDGEPPDEVPDATAELNLVIARRILGWEIHPADYAGIHARLLAHAMIGQRDEAEALATRATEAARASPTTWELVALVRRHYGDDVSRELAIGDVARGQPLADGPSQVAAATYDIATFRGYPADGLVSGAERLLPVVPWPWVLDPLLAPAGSSRTGG